MSKSPTEPDINLLDLNELRQHLKDQSLRLKAQADHITIAEKAKTDADLTLLAQTTTNSFSPVDANLSANLNAAVPMDAQQVTTLLSQMETRLLSQMETRLLAVFQQHSTHQSHTGPSLLSAASSGPQVSSGPPGVFSPPGPQPLHGLSAFPSVSGSNIPTLAATVFNEYDKAVEVDQKKLRNPESTTIALRKWKRAYNTFVSDPHKRMKMTETFGEESLQCLGLMLSDDPVPLNDSGFDAYLNTKFLKSVHLFSDIKTALKN